MHAPLGGVDVVGEGDDDLVVGVGVLEGHLGHGVLLGPGHVDDPVVDGVLVAVDIVHELPDAPGVAHGLGDGLLPPVIGNGDGEAGVEEGLLPHPGVEGVEVVLRGLGEHLRVGLEGDDGAGPVGVPHHGHLLGDQAPGKLHLVDLALLVDLDGEPLAQGVDHGGAHAVEAAGDLIAPAAELAAGVEDGEDHLQGGLAGLLLDIHGDTPAVVGDGDDVVPADLHGNLGAVARQGLVDGVIHDLVDQVVQAAGGGGADVHARPLPHGLQALQHLDLRGAVGVFHCRGVVVFQLIHRDTSNRASFNQSLYSLYSIRPARSGRSPDA